MLGPTVLVLAPTRELASQIQDEVVKFGQSSRVSCTVSSDLISFIMALSFLVYNNKALITTNCSPETMCTFFLFC